MTNPTDQMLTEAHADASMYGIGIIKIENTSDGQKMSRVPHDEFVDLAECLVYVTQNWMHFTRPPPKS